MTRYQGQGLIAIKIIFLPQSHHLLLCQALSVKFGKARTTGENPPVGHFRVDIEPNTFI